MGLAKRSALLCGLPDLTYKQGTENIFAGELFHIDYDVGGTDPSHTLSLSLSACSGSAREGRSWKQSKSEREREMEREKERRNQIYS